MKNLLLVLIACTIACTMPSCKTEEASNKYDLDSFPPINPHELFKKIEVVQLDSIPEQPILSISKAVFRDNLFYIRDLNRASLLVYNEAGEFVRTICSKGRGPGELLDIRDFQINRFTGNLEILGNPSPSIMIYDTKGNFIGQRNVGNRPISIDKFYHINSDLTAWFAYFSEDYKISVFSEKQNQVVHELSLGMDKAFAGNFHYRNPFSHYRDTTYFFDTYSNTIYQFNDKNLEFEVHKTLDFGKHNFDKSLLPHPQEWKVMDVDQKREVARKISKFTLEHDRYIETDEYTILNKLYHYIFTRKEDNSVIQFNSFPDSLRFTMRDMNSNYAFSIWPVSHFNKAINESMIGKEVYQELEALRIEDINQEKYIIIKYWFK